ncbi:hypothetical protein BCR44DRAFT_1436184 [Catenaria anguillulae PL171]|uniref:YMC020W-like alpha/beta hydrolase domain-containing protein n=1 Tax=Catenaria anguillulae PL171 TaxID=765915 RepID=A0A1Y2HIN9_9FUNG|nr:hypothetical protein BCR44DRAFT_1436184 [Catenaria anguillulae PL171]
MTPTRRRRRYPLTGGADTMSAAEGPGSDATTSTRAAIESAAANRPPRRKRHSPTNLIEPWLDFEPPPIQPVPPLPSPNLAPPPDPAGNAASALGRVPEQQASTSLWRKLRDWVGRWTSAAVPAAAAATGTAPSPPPPQLDPIFQAQRKSQWTAEHGIPPELSSICVIGVHGWFPMKVVQRVVGEPTGTSSKFCDQMHLALRQFIDTHYPGATLPDSAVTLIPLECQGRVEYRVDRMFEQVIDPTYHVPTSIDDRPNAKSYWQSKLETCRTVFVVSHSQGAPTSVMLAEKLVATGIIDLHTQSLVVLAQAGIFHGPFPANAQHLFEFNKHDSHLGKRVRDAAEDLLTRGAKLTLVSSWLDQVVPLYSSAFHALTHPNIYRAVFIDAPNAYPDDFLAHLVIFALNLRNHDLPDSDLLVYLSDVVAGSLYFGTAGHSTLYEDVRVFELAIHHLFHRSDTSRGGGGGHGGVYSWITKPRDWIASWATGSGADDAGADVRPFDAPMRLNTYHLPWIMHELVSNRAIRQHPDLSRELKRLVQLYREWDVSGSKVRQQLKYRLDALNRAKL